MVTRYTCTQGGLTGMIAEGNSTRKKIVCVVIKRCPYTEGDEIAHARYRQRITLVSVGNKNLDVGPRLGCSTERIARASVSNLGRSFGHSGMIRGGTEDGVVGSIA